MHMPPYIYSDPPKRPEDTGELRDYFAAAALQGLIAYHGDKMHIVDSDGRTSLHLIAYDHADAMLNARGAA